MRSFEQPAVTLISQAWASSTKLHNHTSQKYFTEDGKYSTHTHSLTSGG